MVQSKSCWVIPYCTASAKVLIAKRASEPVNHWNFFGGKAEPGEKRVEAACREFHEEAGIRLTSNDLRSFGKIKYNGRNLNYFLFLTDEQFTPVMNPENKVFAWVNPFKKLVKQVRHGDKLHASYEGFLKYLSKKLENYTDEFVSVADFSYNNICLNEYPGYTRISVQLNNKIAVFVDYLPNKQMLTDFTVTPSGRGTGAALELADFVIKKFEPRYIMTDTQNSDFFLHFGYKEIGINQQKIIMEDTHVQPY